MALVGACSNIIGVSGYEIDPALDEVSDGGKGSGKGGTPSRSGSNTGSSGGEGGDGTAGTDIGGSTSTAGKTSMGGKGNPTAGTGAGGEPPAPDCTTAAECDDEIDCTTDSCTGGACVHTPKDTLCDSTQCETCQAGIGCVAGPKDVVQLLQDPSFDLSPSDWDDSDSYQTNVVTLAGAHSGTKVAKFGPTLDDKEQDYSDLLQWITIPEGTVALTLTGWYRVTPGSKAPEDDYVVAAFYESGGTRPFSQFHSFEAASTAPAFKMFSYNALKSDVKEMPGNEYSFDLVGYAWDSVFYFDTLQLNATVCQ